MKFTYLAIDLISFSIPFLFTFHPRLKFYEKWKWFLPSLLFSTIIFCSWDAIFTHIGIWGFNDKYTTGIEILNLPVEEILFFICIPYACVFSYHCFGIVLDEKRFRAKWLAYILSFILIVAAILYRDRVYTFVNFTFCSALLFILARKKFMGTFFFTWLIMLIPFFIVNGILTGTGINQPVVWYNSDEIIGFRILTIPIEDIFYGMLLMLLNIAGMEWLQSRHHV